MITKSSIHAALRRFFFALLLTGSVHSLSSQSTEATSAGDQVQINLPGNSVNEVLGLYEILSGRRLVREANLSGPDLSVVANGSLSRRDAIALLESVLLLNGYSLVPLDSQTTKVISSKKSPLGEAVPLYVDPGQLPAGEQVVSYFMSLRYISAKDAFAIFQGYVSLREQGKIVVVPNANALVISDNTPLIRRLIDLQRLVDVPGAKVLTEFVPLIRADAEKVAATINKLLDQEKKQGEGSADKNLIASSGATNTSPTQDAGPASSVLSASAPVQVVADARTNRILIVANESRMGYIRALVQNLDEAVALEQPLERALRFVSAGDVLPVLQSILAEGDEVATGQAGQLAPPPREQQVEDNFLSSGGTSPSGGGTGKPDKLTAPRESTAPLAVSVGKARIIADRSANKIIVIGPPESRNKASRVLDMLDQKPKQVYLATVIGQLTLGDGLEVGFDYLIKNKSLTAGGGNSIGGLLRTRGGATDLLPDPTALITNAALPLASGLTIYGTIAETVDIYAKALSTDSRFKILSRPVVYTANNKKAVISSGQAVPIPVSTLTSAIATGGNNDTGTALASNIQYKDVVLKLEVIPLINSDNEVTLTVAQQNDSILERVIVSDNEVPVIGTQELTTTITVKNRQTIVLGGLITEENQDLKTGVPLVSDIPGLGYLFSTTKKQKTRRELIVLIQPLIVASEADEAEANYIEKAMSHLQDELYEAQVPVRRAEPVKKSSSENRKSRQQP